MLMSHCSGSASLFGQVDRLSFSRREFVTSSSSPVFFLSEKKSAMLDTDRPVWFSEEPSCRGRGMGSILALPLVISHQMTTLYATPREALPDTFCAMRDTEKPPAPVRVPCPLEPVGTSQPATNFPPLVCLAWPTVTRVSRISATWSFLARLNPEAISSGVAGLPRAVRAWRMAWKRSGRVVGHAALAGVPAALAAPFGGLLLPFGTCPFVFVAVVLFRLRCDQLLLCLLRSLRVLELRSQPADFPAASSAARS